MFQGMKSSRQLSLLIALTLSAGGQPFFNHAHAADVTGGDVVIDAGHPGTPIGNAHDIPGATDNRNVVGNKLTLDGVAPYQSYGGYTAGTGNATNNTIIYKNFVPLNGYGYAGYSAGGNATNNIAILTNSPATTSLYLYGGASGNGGADVRTGNELRATTKNNNVARIYNFEKLHFDLDSSINSGDYLLYVRDNTGQSYD